MGTIFISILGETMSKLQNYANPQPGEKFKNIGLLLVAFLRFQLFGLVLP